jgi:biotin carboxylase
VTLAREEAEVEAKLARVQQGLATSRDVARLLDFARIEPVELGCDPRRDLLVEAFAHGDPVEVDGLVAGRSVESFGVTEQVHSAARDFFIEGYMFPADRPAAEVRELEALSERALEALGVRDSGFSVELRAGAGGPSLIEVNGRLGVDEGFGDLFAAVIGEHPVALAFALAFGRRPRWKRSEVRAAVAYRCHYERGVVERVPGEAELAELYRDRVAVSVHVRPGEELYAAGDPRIRPHVAHALVLDPQSSRRARHRAARALDRLELRCSRGAVPSPA